MKSEKGNSKLSAGTIMTGLSADISELISWPGQTDWQCVEK